LGLLEITLSRLLRLALIPILVAVAFSNAGEDGWETVDVPAVKFKIQDLEGRPLTEKAFEGKVAVVDFWATWCGPCVQELPELGRFAEKIKDRKDVVFLSFSVDDDKEDVANFFKGRKEKFPVYMASSLSDQMEVIIFPTKLIIDGRKGTPGRVRLRKEGVIELAELESRVAELLKKP
jgi:thiol-disulfide isomerase/thioredoxin